MLRLLALFALSTVPVASGERGDETSAIESEADLHESHLGRVSNHTPPEAASGDEKSASDEKTPAASEPAAPAASEAAAGEEKHSGDEKPPSGSNSRELLAEDTAKMEEARKAAEKKSDEAHAALKDYVKAKESGVRAFEELDQMVQATRKRSVGYFAAREVANDHPLQEIVHTPDMDDKRDMVQKFQHRVNRYFSKSEEKTAGAGHAAT